MSQSNAYDWYKRYPKKFIRGVRGLGPDLIGAYAVILDLIYEDEDSCPNDPAWLGGILGCNGRKSRALIDGLIAAGKLRLNDAGRLVNEKATSELKNRATLRQQARDGGSTGAGRRLDSARTQSGRSSDTEDAQCDINELHSEDPMTLREEKNRGEENREEKIPPNPPGEEMLQPPPPAAPAAPAGVDLSKLGPFEAALIGTFASIMQGEKNKHKRKPPRPPHPDFPAFWDAFPSKRDEKAARRSYNAATDSRALPPTLLEGAKRYAEECKGKSDQFIKTASKWLAGDCWKNPAFKGAKDLEKRAEEVLNGSSKRHLRNLELTYPDSVTKRFELLERAAGQSDPVIWLNRWMWKHGAPDCNVGSVQ